MTLNNRGEQFLLGDERWTEGNFGDTILRLNCFGYGDSTRNGFGGNQTDSSKVDFLNSSADDGCKLVLGLGPTPSVYSDNNYYGTGINKSKGATGLAISPQGLSSEDESILQLGLSGGTSDSLSGYDCSEVDLESRLQKQVICVNNRSLIPIVDEGSTSAKKSGGYMPGLLLAPRMNDSKASSQMELLEFGTSFHSNDLQMNHEQSATMDVSLGAISGQATTFSSSDHRAGNSKRCKYHGCSRGARGASGLCIGHGGGQRCKKPGCNKGAESKAAFCKAHGGGSRCQHLGCTKSAEGKTDFCIAHGGGRRCGHLGGCTKAARGKSGLCIRHGGGKRCKIEGCTRSAEGQAGLCISHGGGRRCQHPGCTKGAQGSTLLCKAHGGGRRCIFAGCTKGAEGSTLLCKGHGGGKRCMYDGAGVCPKSVHGGTNFCVAHGGGKRCVVPGCTKSARGRTDCCVRHGGGKRCKFEDCGKSAQGSTDYCKAHGGGKRCSWENGKCEKFARGKSGLCAAHSSLVLGRERKKGGLIGPGLFHGLVSATSTTASSTENTYSSSTFHTVSDCIDSFEKPAKRQHLTPSQMPMPPSIISSSSYSTFFPTDKQDEAHRSQFDTGISSSSLKNLDYMLPEGRVHGGGLMSLLVGNLKNAYDGI